MGCEKVSIILCYTNNTICSHITILGWEIDPNRYLIVDETILGDRLTKYDKMSEIVQKTLKSSTPNQLHLICSHDIMIGDCIRTLFPDLVGAQSIWFYPKYLEGFIWTENFAIWNGNRIPL